MLTRCHHLQTFEKVNITNLPSIFIHITRCVCERCQLMDTNEECLCCQEVAPISEKMEDKHLKCITEHDGFRGNCLNIDVLEVSMYEFIDRDGPLDDNEPIHK